MPPHQLIGLISGGKDSIYNLQKCIHYGHSIVALAYLSPKPNSGKSELDSHCFQTVGHQLIHTIAEALQLPLYIEYLDTDRPSVNTDLQYAPTDNDEVEQLYKLLQHVIDKHPTAQGVSSGAILSNYQRLRIESVCYRLGLTSYAYLWQHKQSALLNEMISHNIDAILLKTASAGLNAHKHCGKTLKELQPYLMKLGTEQGINVCGEGGEYESLVLDCELYHKRIVIDESEVVAEKEDAQSGDSVGYLNIKQWHLEAKETPALNAHKDAPQQPNDGMKVVSSEHGSRRVTANSPVLNMDPLSIDSATSRGTSPTAEMSDIALHNVTEAKGNAIFMSLDPERATVPTYATSTDSFPPDKHASGGPASTDDPEGVSSIAIISTAEHTLAYTVNSSHSAIDYVNVTASCAMQSSISVELKQQMQIALTGVLFELARHDCSIEDVFYVHLILSDLNNFGEANNLYSQALPLHNAPSRACVQMVLPDNGAVLVNCIAKKSNAPPQHQRQVLHVKSVSEWAPSCIGPYSQASTVDGIVYLAGQIGLDPPTMELPSASRDQVANCVKHVQAVLGCTKTDTKSMIAVVVFIADAVVQNDEYGYDEIAADYQQLLSESRVQPIFISIPALPRKAVTELQCIAVEQQYSSNIVHEEQRTLDLYSVGNDYFANLNVSYARGHYCFVSLVVTCDATVDAVETVPYEIIRQLTDVLSDCAHKAKLTMDTMLFARCYHIISLDTERTDSDTCLTWQALHDHGISMTLFPITTINNDENVLMTWHCMFVRTPHDQYDASDEDS